MKSDSNASNAFRLYYQQWLIITNTIALLLVMLKNYNGYIITIPHMLTIFCYASGIAMFFGGILHFHYDVYEPWRIRRLLNHDSLSVLEQYGFHRTVDEYQGIYKHFQVHIYPLLSLYQGEQLAVLAPFIRASAQVNPEETLANTYELIALDQGFLAITRFPLFSKELAPEHLLRIIDHFLATLVSHGAKPMIVEKEAT